MKRLGWLLLAAIVIACAGVSPAVGVGVPPHPFPLVQPPFNWVGIVGSGQSLSVGYNPAGNYFLSTTQPYSNLMLTDNGPNPKFPIVQSTTAQWTAIPLVEPMRPAVPGTGPGYSDNQYPNDLYGETGQVALGSTMSQIWSSRPYAAAPYITAHTIVGQGSAPLTQLNLAGGYRAFPASMNEVGVWSRLAAAQGLTYGVGAIVLVHEEADATNPAYGTELLQFYLDYAQRIRTLTKQWFYPPIFFTQESAVVAGATGAPIQAWNLTKTNPGQFVLVGPEYAAQYAQDLLHKQAQGYIRMYEKIGQVVDQQINQGVQWQPLQPVAVTRSGATITITMHVPSPPMTWDANIPAPHLIYNTQWSGYNGLEVFDSTSTALAFTGSPVISGNTITATLASIPTNLPLQLGYGITQDSTGFNGGTQYGLIGLLRDSDPYVPVDTQTVMVNVQSGSANVTPVTTGGLLTRTKYDLVIGSGFAAGTVVTAMDNNNAPTVLTLSHPWTGVTGTANVTFQGDMGNHCIHWVWSVP